MGEAVADWKGNELETEDGGFFAFRRYHHTASMIMAIVFTISSSSERGITPIRLMNRHVDTLFA